MGSPFAVACLSVLGQMLHLTSAAALPRCLEEFNTTHVFGYRNTWNITVQ